MVSECIEALALKAGGIYVDATLGGGGHALAMLRAEPKIQLFGFDQDVQALEQAQTQLGRYGDQVVLNHSNFARIRTDLALSQIKRIDGVIFDLGVSSHQIDDPTRGFGFDSDAMLDMRMDTGNELTAHHVVNQYTQQELKRIFREYGEELYADRISKAIEFSRRNKEIQSPRELSSIIEKAISGSPKEIVKSKARIFQSIRICVNRELEVLPQALVDCINILKPGGRIVVLSYHSLEDRIVKNTFRTAALACTCPPASPICNCNVKAKLTLLTRKPILPNAHEQENNPRSRSAKLRIGERKGK